MNSKRLQKLTKNKLIELILIKDQELENINNRIKNFEEVGSLFIKGKHYSFLIRDDKK